MSDAILRTITEPTSTPQTEAVPGKEMIRNHAGGYVFQVDDWTRLHRFLVLGTEGGTYYANERDHTLENIACVDKCVAADGIRTVQTIVDISKNGRAHRNTQAIYALAVAASSPDAETRKAANTALTSVCRTGTHLYQFAGFMKALDRRGWGRGLRNAVANVLVGVPVEKAALHAVKYRQREGWTYRDLYRLSHPKTNDPARMALGGFIMGEPDLEVIAEFPELNVVRGYLLLNQGEYSDRDAAKIIGAHNLPWEAVPDKFRSSKLVWDQIIPNMGLTALVRNLSVFARNGWLTPLGELEKHIVSRLTSPEEIQRSREHPMRFLDASRVHASGGTAGLSRGSSYQTNRNIVEALDDAFVLAFDNVEPAGQNFYLGIDVSGSMDWSGVSGSPAVTCRDAAAAMALITAKTEPYTYSAAFSGKMQELKITRNSTLSSTIKATASLSFDRTDCALPMIDALKKKIEVDVFVIYTDNETWAGNIHPFQALREYREKMGRPAKLAVVGMRAEEFSIADPSDAGMMDFVGFDTATPNAISMFAAGI